MILEVDINYITHLLDNTLISNNSKISIIDNNNNPLFLSQRTKLSTSIDNNSLDNLSNNKFTSTNTIVLKDKLNINIYTKLDNGWYYIIQTPLSDYLEDIREIKIFGIIIGLLAWIISILIGIILSARIEYPLRHLINKIKLVEQGDLTARSNIIGNKELGKLSSSFNYMLENMNQLINTVYTLSEEVTGTSKELMAISNETFINNTEISTAIESVTAGATEQALDSERTSKIFNEFIDIITETEKVFNDILHLSNSALKSCAKGNIVMNNLKEATRKILFISSNIKEDADNLSNNLENVLQIVDIISNLNKQTNTLSLDAAIEIARSNTFDEIGVQIRTLANESNTSAKKIVQIIEETSALTNHTKQNANTNIAIFNNQIESIKYIDITFEEIINEINNIFSKVSIVNKLFTNANNYKEISLELLSPIVSVSQHSAASIEEILSSGEEQLSVSDNLVDIATSLNEKTHLVLKSLSTFKI